MKQKIMISLTVLGLLSGCGGSGTISKMVNDTADNRDDNKTSPATDAGQQSQQTVTESRQVSLQKCIDNALLRQNRSKETLEQLSCAALTGKDFGLLGALRGLKSLRIVDTPLNAGDVRSLSENINREKVTTLVLENDALTKDSVDNLSPGFDYQTGQYYTSMKNLSLKENKIEGLLVVDFFPALETLDLEGNVFSGDRLHHIGHIEALKHLILAGNPNIIDLNDFGNAPKTEASVEVVDIANMSALRDISEFENFLQLKRVTIDNAQQTRFASVLQILRDRGVEINIR